MTKRRMVMQLGMGTDLQGQDYTKAACRAVHNALRQNSLHVYDAFGVSRDEMIVEITIGAQKPEEVKVDDVAAMLPYGSRHVNVEAGGMDTPKEDGGTTIMVNAAVVVFLNLPEGKTWGQAT